MSDEPSGEPHPLDRLRDRVLADARLQAELAPLDAETLARRLPALAAETGIALDPADFAPYLRGDPLGISASSDPVPLRACWPGPDWLPVLVDSLPDGEIIVDWAHFAGARLTTPLFLSSVRASAARPFNRLFRYRMRLDDFIAEAAGEALPEPDGFIFHMSRCGSTLVARMLASLPESEILSEAPPLDIAARLGVSGHVPDPVALLRAMVGAFGRRGGQPFVVKLDFWQALALPLYRRAFPSVPWLFLFRDPVEVLMSQMHRRGAETMPEAHLIPGIDAAGSEEDQIAQALAAICGTAADEAATGGGLFVDYAALPEAAFTAILPHFGIDAVGEARAAMEAVVTRDAKNPSKAFDADAEAKRARADERICGAARRLGPVYERLTRLRA